MTVGIGIHVRAGDVRAVMVEADGVGVRMVVDAVEEADGHGDELAALVRLAGRLGGTAGVPACLACDAGTVTENDVTGLDTVALDALFERRARAGDDAVVIVGDHRRVALTLAWDEGRSATLTAAARRAGFAASACEPSAVAARRTSSGDAAVGAALVACGLAAGRTVRALRTSESAGRPWVIERVDEAPDIAPSRRRRWRRAARSVAAPFRRRAREGGPNVAR